MSTVFLDFCFSPPLSPRCVWGNLLCCLGRNGGTLTFVWVSCFVLWAPLFFVMMSYVHQIADTLLSCPAKTCNWRHVVHFFLSGNCHRIFTISPLLSWPGSWTCFDSLGCSILILCDSVSWLEQLVAGLSALNLLSTPHRWQEGHNICLLVALLSLFLYNIPIAFLKPEVT